MPKHIYIHRRKVTDASEQAKVSPVDRFGDFEVTYNGRKFNCRFDGKYYRTGMMRASSIKGLVESIQRTVR